MSLRLRLIIVAAIGDVALNIAEALGRLARWSADFQRDGLEALACCDGTGFADYASVPCANPTCRFANR